MRFARKPLPQVSFSSILPFWVQRQFIPGLAALAGGYGIFVVARFAGTISSGGLAVSALIEESLKALLAFILALSCMRQADAPAPEPGSAEGIRRCLWRREGAVRGLGFGLVACTAFALTENLAYALVFPESGIFARLWWSVPVHMISSFLSAAGLFPILILVANRKAPVRERRTDTWLPIKTTAWFAASSLFHYSANLIVSTGPSPLAVNIAGLVLVLAVLAAYRALFQKLYIGGIFHGFTNNGQR